MDDASAGDAIDPRQLAEGLELPARARAVVVFAHGSGSSRHSPRNRRVAQAIRERGFGTMLFDLLDPREAADRAHVFDIGLLAARLGQALHWLAAEPRTAALAPMLFGASTGAAAALVAAAEEPRVRAVVSRGGRADLAGQSLEAVRAATLLIVGDADPLVLELNREARARVSAPCELAIVRGAGHLFEEPGALDEVTRLAGDWFERWLERCDDGPLA